jgi:Flp pilus assembly protein TadG
MIRPLCSGNGRRGVATVELAIVISILLFPMVVGLVEVGRLNEVQQILNNAVREGARQGAAGQMSDTQCESVVRLYLYNEGLPITNAVVTVTNLGFPGNPSPIDNNPQDATDLDQIQVTLTLPYADVAWLNLGMFLSSTATMTATANWSSCKDRAYPVPTPPPGF